MSDSPSSYNEIFKKGHPCENCITKSMCKRIRGEYDLGHCDLPEQYDFWQLAKVIEKCERDALKGDKESIKGLARVAKKQLEETKSAWNRGRAAIKEMEDLFKKEV